MKLNLLIITMMTIVLFSCNSKKEKELPITKEGYVAVTGGKVWYKICGADKKGIPLLVLHGGPGAPHDYLHPLEEIAKERPVIFYDQLGCGNSDKPSDSSLWNLPRFVEELEQVRTALHLDKLHILGQSWGSMLAASYMIEKNQKGIISLIFSGAYLSSPRWISDQKKWVSQLPVSIQDTIAKYEKSGDFASPAYQEAMTIFYNKHLCRLDPWPPYLIATLEKSSSEIYGYMIGPSEFTLNGTLKETDLTDQLHKIKCPVLFTCGEFDEATPWTTAYYQSKIQGSEIYVFKEASHSHHIEKEDEYLKVVSDFLRKAER